LKKSELNPLGYGGACTLPLRDDCPALVVQDLGFTYPRSETPALAGVSVKVKKGELVSLVGPNGAGKSTLLKLIVGQLTIQQGSIEVYGCQAHACRHRVSIVPQRSTVDWRFPITVHQVVLMGRYVHLGWLKKPGTQDYEAVDRALENMKIRDLRDRQIGELSGGQQQRVMLARTLAHDAELLLLDEPLNHVDIGTQELIFHTLEKLTQMGKTVLISTHDLGILKVHFSRTLFLDKSIKADGPAAEILTPETIAEAYGFQFHKEEAVV